MSNHTPKTLLRRTEVEARTKLSRAALYAKLSPNDASFDPSFPVPIRISACSIRWIEEEIDSWIESRPRARQHKSVKTTSCVQ